MSILGSLWKTQILGVSIQALCWSTHGHLARCICQDSGKYLASPRVLQPSVRLSVFRQILSQPRTLGHTSLCHVLCGCVRLCVPVRKAPLRAALHQFSLFFTPAAPLKRPAGSYAPFPLCLALSLCLCLYLCLFFLFIFSLFPCSQPLSSAPLPSPSLPSPSMKLTPWVWCAFRGCFSPAVGLLEPSPRRSLLCHIITLGIPTYFSREFFSW